MACVRAATPTRNPPLDSHRHVPISCRDMVVHLPVIGKIVQVLLVLSCVVHRHWELSPQALISALLASCTGSTAVRLDAFPLPRHITVFLLLLPSFNYPTTTKNSYRTTVPPPCLRKCQPFPISLPPPSPRLPLRAPCLFFLF